MTKTTNPVVFTDKAECRDCYRCLRVCPVKAIRMENGQASVDSERCIACGTCIRECPQGAKSFRNDLERAIRLVEQNAVVAVSIAPSFAALFSGWQRRRLPSALRYLGFSYVAETSVAAHPVAVESLRLHAPNRSSICTACPAVVSYVEKYVPELVGNLLPVASPMVTHARMIKEKLGSDAKVVFVGPCVAKKAEAENCENEGAPDCVLTFMELSEWFERADIHLDRLEDSSFDEEPTGQSRLFPLPSGLTKTAEAGSDNLSSEVIAVSGIDDLNALLRDLDENAAKSLVEPLFCSQGCINGPGMPGKQKLFQNRNSILSYSEESPGKKQSQKISQNFLRANYKPAPIAGSKQFSESEIQMILEATGKTVQSDQLNCGACGYQSCRDKAIAVLEGLAEIEMCIPYMRRLAEQRTDRIIETSPNGIVMLNEKLCIISMNPAFRKMFFCSEAVLGKHVSYLVDPQPFEKILTGSQSLIEETVNHAKYSLVAHQIIYQLQAEKQIVGIFVNITGSRKSQEQLDKLRASMIQQAREMLEHQIKMAQELAMHLGQSTAQGEILIENLLKLASAESEKEDPKKRDSQWDIFTSK
ncbi:MAG: hypothetical protein PWR01_4478 [Clostridiales bacterium]|nr:hypothetical protein [Clostridiales bacterium]MDN5283405.1 hypothetical protein [Candidatus Ozemobacter sp.]